MRSNCLKSQAIALSWYEAIATRTSISQMVIVGGALLFLLVASHYTSNHRIVIMEMDKIVSEKRGWVSWH